MWIQKEYKEGKKEKNCYLKFKNERDFLHVSRIS